MFSVVGRGCVILECRDDVRLGMTRFSAWSRVGGRSPVRGRRLSEGAMLLMRIEGSSELGQTQRLWEAYISERSFLLDGQDARGVTDPGANETAREGCRSKVSYGAARSSFKKKHTDPIFPPDRAGEAGGLSEVSRLLSRETP